jgi:hypothetical protein
MTSAYSAGTRIVPSVAGLTCARSELEKWNAAPHDLEHLMQGLHRAALST